MLLPDGAAVLPLFLCSTFLLMTLNYLYAICRMGLVKEMLPDALLLPATGQLTVVSQVAAVVGPALAGLLVSWQLSLGLWQPMFALLLAALLLQGLSLPERAVVAAGFWQDWLAGVRVLRANRPLWQLSWLVVLINGSAGVVDVLFLFRARDELQLSPGVIGVMYALAGVGGIVGGGACSRLRNRFGLGRLMVLSLAVETLCIVALAWASALPVLVPCWPATAAPRWSAMSPSGATGRRAPTAPSSAASRDSPDRCSSWACRSRCGCRDGWPMISRWASCSWSAPACIWWR